LGDGGGTDTTGRPTTTEAAVRGWLTGPDLAVTNGQRLRFRVYADDCSAGAMAVVNNSRIYFAGTAANASGDSWIQLSQTVTQSGGSGTATAQWSANASATGKRITKGTATATYTENVDASGAMPGSTPPGDALWLWTQGPVDTQVDADTAPIVVGTRFTVDTECVMTSIRYYRPPYYGSGVTLELRLHQEP